MLASYIFPQRQKMKNAPLSDIEFETRRALIKAWLEQNILYARSHVKKAIAAKDGDRVRDWETWRSFSEHALGEIQDRRLDLWIAELGNPDFDPTTVDDAASNFGEA